MKSRSSALALVAFVWLAACNGSDVDDTTDVPPPPTLRVLSHDSGAVSLEPSVKVTGTVDTPGGLAHVTARVNGGEPREATLEALSASESRFEVEVALVDGANAVELVALNTAGLEARQVVTLTYATPPQVRVVSPTDGLAFTVRRVRVEATATDNAGVVALTYSLNGGEPRALEVPAASDGAFAFDVTPRPGKNHVVLRARDALGNEGERAVDFQFGNIATAGGLHSGTLRDGRVYVWGRNLSGQLGLGPGVPTGQKTPQPVPGLEDMAAIAFNQSFSMALGADGSVWTWGANDKGQLGLGTPPVEGEPHTPDVARRDSAERIQGITGAVAVAPGFEHALVLMEDGTVRAFGDNEAGQLGDGTFESRDYPVTVAGLTGVVKVMAGSAHSLALRGDGTVWAWGRNTYGNLGTGTPSTPGRPTAAEVPGLKDVVDIANGRDHVLAVHSDGTVSSWGLGASGQLGRGTTTTSATPEKVPGITQARAAFANGNYGFVRLVDGSLMSWGQNGNGQLGDGSQTQRAQPVVAGLAVKPLAGMGMGATHVIAVRADGAVYAWGWNLEGSLGPDAVIDRWSYTDPIPVPVP